jgi:hypothetical protein
VIPGSTIDEIANHLDQVSAHAILFHFNGLISSFSVHIFSIRGCKLETRVCVGCSSSGHIHNLTYAGKVKHVHVYDALYVTVISVEISIQIKYFLDSPNLTIIYHC